MGTTDSGALSGEIRVPESDNDGNRPALTERKVIARRAAMELVPDAVVNLGVGVPELVPTVAAEGGVGDEITQTVEAGPIGGSPSGGINFGTAVDHDALVSSPEQFDFYDGGELDIGFLGMAQIDAAGNVNVSRFGADIPGCGGFINITQNAEQVIFCGTLTAGDLDVAVGDGEIEIRSEGTNRKFVEQVEQVTFSGEYAVEIDQPITYVTERAVFELTDSGLVLVEVAPGIDIEKEVLGEMVFDPVVAEDVTEMPQALFEDSPFALRSYVE